AHEEPLQCSARVRKPGDGESKSSPIPTAQASEAERALTETSALQSPLLTAGSTVRTLCHWPSHTIAGCRADSAPAGDASTAHEAATAHPRTSDRIRITHLPAPSSITEPHPIAAGTSLVKPPLGFVLGASLPPACDVE